MGVTSLWTILQPCARPTPLPTLNRKRLAVDASIWIYQFLKAVRDKEGNALRNSHVVGFFRRICKLLFFGIKPVFVFDGGAPVLKRQTVLNRKKRREGRREDAVRTAGRLLAVQMQRRGEEEVERRKRDRDSGQGTEELDENEEPVPENPVYVDENNMTAQERQAKRKFYKKDAYHLPELENGIEGMGQPNDPRIMSHEELEEYARQFHNGEDINLYDFSKIDFNGEFFMSLPAGDRYNILNAARLRSRLRMGLSKEQLEDMFPNRMDFSRFQIERVRERNELTQRLMNLNGMNGVDVTAGGRIAGERGREYVLVRNEGVEGGWALGVVSAEKGVGERNKPIDVDAANERTQVEFDELDSEDDFEDVPIEGLNRLPKAQNRPTGQEAERGYPRRSTVQAQPSISDQDELAEVGDPDSLFVGEEAPESPQVNNGHDEEEEDLRRAIALSLQKDSESDEEGHLNKAIALSLQKQHDPESEPEDEIFEDVPMPDYKQQAVEAPKPIGKSSGKMVAHIVNNRANAAVPKRKAVSVSSGSDSDMDMQAALKKAKKGKAPERKRQLAPVASNTKNPFDGPLPFEKLSFGSSIFGKKVREDEVTGEEGDGDDHEIAGGFIPDREEEKARPLPPWLVGTNDIREQVQEQKERNSELNAEDKEEAFEEQRRYEKEHGIIEIESSDEGSDVEVLDEVPIPETTTDNMGELAEDIRAQPPQLEVPDDRQPSVEPVVVIQDKHSGKEATDDEEVEWSESDYGDVAVSSKKVVDAQHPAGVRLVEDTVKSGSSSPLFEDVITSPKSAVDSHKAEEVEAHSPTKAAQTLEESDSSIQSQAKSPSPVFEDVDMPDTASTFPSKPPPLPQDGTFEREQAEIVGDIDFDEFSDPEDEELLAQLAVEAEEHARFASTLNHKSERENQEAYEKELKALRNQQKKDRRDADEVSHIMITECQALLRLFGLPYITAPMEAEAQCAELVNLGLVDGIVTDDSDIFLFGGTRVYKNMFNSNKFVECYLSSDLEKELSLSREQLISIAHLLGSDYTEGLPGVGPITAVEILSEFPSPTSGLQDFAEWWNHAQTHASNPLTKELTTFRKKFRKSQGTKLFLPPGFPSEAVTQAYLHPDVDSTPEAFQWGVPDLDALREFLMATIGWSQERTDEVLVPVFRDMNRREAEGTQSNITRFFEGGVGTGVRKEGTGEKGMGKGSKRMKEAVGRLKAKKVVVGAVDGKSMTVGGRASEWARREEERSRKEGGEGTDGVKRRKEKGEKKGRKRKRKVAEVVVESDGGAEQSSVLGDDADADVSEVDTHGKANGKGRKARRKVDAM